MEPEDLPWPGELEEEEEEEVEIASPATEEVTEAETSKETVRVEEEEAVPEADPDFNFEFQPRESTDEEEDEMAQAWLQAHPDRTFAPPPPPPPRHLYGPAERTPPEPAVPLTCHVWQQSLYQDSSRAHIPDSSALLLETEVQWGSEGDQRAESWHPLSQERDSSQSLGTSQTRINVRTEGMEVTDFPSLEEGELTQSEDPVQELKLDLLCSPLLVIQDNFATPDLPLLTCLTQDQEFEPESLFQQSEREFAPLRGIPDQSEDIEWLSRPSEVSEALFQAISETSSDLVNSCLSISQHPLTGSTTFGSQRSLFPSEQENNGETGPSNAADELKTPSNSDHYDALYSYISWQTRKDTQQPEGNVADKNQVSTSTFSDVSEESITNKRDGGFDASCSQVQYWRQGASQQAEACLADKDRGSLPCEIALSCPNKMSYSFLRCMLQRGKGAALTSGSHPENVYLRARSEDEMNQKTGSLEGYERNKDLQKELSQYFKQKETRNNLISSELHPISPEIKYMGTVVIPDNREQVSEAHILSRGLDISKVEASGGPLRTVKSSLDETSEQQYFQEERNQKAASIFGEKNVGATENVAFEAVIAAIEPSKQESPVSEAQADVSKRLADDSQEREPPNSDRSPLNGNSENSFIDNLKHPKYQSTPGVFEPAASKPMLHKEDDDASSLYWYLNLKSPPTAAQNITVIPELKSPPLSEKAYNQAVGLGETRSLLFPYDIYNLDLTENVGSSNINYPMKASTSDSWVIQDLKQQTFEEVADSSDYYLEGLQGKAESDMITLDGDTEYSSLYENVVVPSERVTELQRETSGLHGLTGEYLELADLVNLLDDLCDSSFYWLPTSQLTSEESNFEKPGDHLDLSTSHPFTSALPPFLPQERTRESEYHSSNLRMLRVSPDALPTTLRRLTGDTSKGGIATLAPSKLKSDNATSFGDSDTGPHSSLPFEDLAQFTVSSLQENAVSHQAYAINQKALADGHLTEESLKVSNIPESADQKTEILAAPSTSYSYREKPSILSSVHPMGQALTVSAVTTPTDLKTGAIALPSSLYSHSEKPSIFYQQELSDSYPTAEALKVLSEPVDQTTGMPIASSISHSHREKPGISYQPAASEETPKASAHFGLAEQNTGTSSVISTSYSQREKPNILHQEGLQEGPRVDQALTVLTFPGQTDQKSGLAMVSSTPSSQRDKPGVVYQQALPGSHLPKETMKASATLGPTDQKSILATAPSTSYSQRDKPGIFYQQASKAGGHLPEDILKASSARRPTDQKFDVPAITMASYAYREEPGIFHQRELPESHLAEESMQGSAFSRPADQNITMLSSTSHSRGEKSHTYHQTLPESYLSHQDRKVSAVPGSVDQNVGAAGVPSAYSHGVKPGSFTQEEWPDRHLTEETQKVSAAPGLTDQKPRTPTVYSRSYSPGVKPDIFYQQLLSDRHPSKEPLEVSAISRSVDQKTWDPTVTSASQPPKEIAEVFYQQTLSDSHLTEEALSVSVVPGRGDQKASLHSESSGSYSHRESIISPKQTLPGTHLPEDAVKVSAESGATDQKTDSPVVSSSTYSHLKKPSILYQQELPDSHELTGTQKVSFVPADQKPAVSHPYNEKPVVFFQQELPDSHPTEKLTKAFVPGPVEQPSGIPSLTSASYSHKERPSISYQQKFPDSHLTENVPKVTGAPGPADQKTGKSKVSSTTSYSQRERSSVFYKQALPGSPLFEEALKASAAPGPGNQNTGTSAVSSGPHPLGEESIIFYQSGLPGSPLTTGPVVSGPTEQKTGTPTGPSGSYPVGEKPIIFYQQALSEEALKASTAPRPTDQSIAISTVTSEREKSGVFYQQALPGGNLPGESRKASAAPGPGDQNTGTSAVPSGPHPLGEESIIFYQPGLPGSPLTTGPVVSGPTEQKTGTPAGPSGSYPVGEKPIIFYQQALPDGHLPKETLNVLTSPGPVNPKTGEPTIYSTSYPFGEKPILYQQALPDAQLTKEGHQVSSGPVDQKTGTALITSPLYVHPENLIVSYQQELPDSHLTENTRKISVVPGPTDQKTGIPTVPSSSSHTERPSVSYQQELPDLSEQSLKVLGVVGPTEQKTGIQILSSSPYSHKERPSVSYQQELPDLSEKALKVLGVVEPAEQKTGIQILSSPYSHKERPSVSYQQELPDLSEKALKVLGVVGPAEQKTGIQILSSSPYSHKERPSVSYQQELPDLTEEALQVLGVPGPSKQKTEIHIVPSVPYSPEEKPIISYQQELPDLTEVTLKTGEVSGSTGQRTGIQIVSSGPYSSREKPSGFHQQELPNVGEETLGVFVHPGPVIQKVGIPTEPLSYYSQREARAFSPQELPASHLTEEALNVPALSPVATQKPGTSSGPSSSYFNREKPSDFYHQALPYHDPTEGSLKASTVPGPSDQNRRTTVPPGSYSFKEKASISTADLSQDQKTKLSTATHSSYLHTEKPVISAVIGPDDQKTPLPTVFHGSHPQRIKPVIFFQKQLPGRDQSEDILKISTVSEPTDVNVGIPVLLSGSYSHTERADTFYPQELPDRHLTEDALKVSSDLGQADQIAWLPTVSPGIYSHDEKHQFVSEHVQRLIDNLNSPGSCLSTKDMPLNSQTDDAVIINKPESSGFGDVGCEEIRDADNSSKTLKEIRTLLMEAENIALKRCNFPAPLVPFRDVNDVSFIQSKKVVCFKEPSTTDVCNPREPFIEECPRIECSQKDIGTQTNLKCQKGIENWEFISSTTIRSPLQEAEDTARVAFDETFRQYEAARSAMRSEPEGCSAAIGKKIIIPMMTIIKSDSSSDVSDGCCSWDSNLPESLESVSDVFLNFFPYTSPKTSITDSRDEERLSESEDGCGSVDSLAAHVKYLLQCESSLNQAKQILRNAEEEECRVRAQAWNLKFNLGHGCGYSISELNEDDRRKVEEIKAKLFGHGRAAPVSEGLQNPREMECVPETVCGHIIIESHEKGCFRTLTTEQPQLDGRPCVFRSAGPSEVTRGQRSPSSWRTRHINLSKSLDQSNSRVKVWNSLQLQSHPPFQQLTPEDFKISKGVGVPFNANVDPRSSELVERTCVPPKEMDFPCSSQTSPSEPMKQLTTSITFSSHRHSKCISDTSVFKVGVTEGSQCTAPSVGVCKSHVPEEQISPRDLRQKISSPSSLKRHSYSPETILAEGDRQRQKLPVDFEHAHQKGKPLGRSDFKVSHSEPSASTNYSKFKGVQFSLKDTLISPDKPSSTLEVKEKNVTLTPDLPSCIFLEQRELFEQSHTPHTDHHVRKYHSPSCPDIASCIFLEQRELFEQSKAPHIDHEMREDHSLFPQCHNYVVSDLPSSIFLEQQQCKSPDVDDHMRNLSQGQDCIVEKIECIPKSHFSNLINVEAKFSNMISQSAPEHCASASTPPSNRKALSCVRITLCPKTPSKLDSGTLDKRVHSLDPASKTKINSEFNSDLQTIPSRSLETTSKLLTCKPIAQDQESLGFLGPKSPLDLQVAQSPLPASKTITQDLKTIPPQNSQIVTSRQTQVNISNLEGYSKPEGTPVSTDGSREQNKTPSGKLSSDAVTQITTESPEKTTFSSEIFINADDRGIEVLDPTTQKPHKVPVRFASSSSVQQITASRGKDAQPELLPYKPSGSSNMYYVPLLKAVPSFPDSKSDTTIESSHSGSNDAIAPEFPPQVLGTRDDDLSATVNIKHKEGIYSKRAVTKGKKGCQKDNAEAPVQASITEDKNLLDKKQKEIISGIFLTKTAGPEEKECLQDTTDSCDAVVQRKTEILPDIKFIKQTEETCIKRTIPQEICPEEEKSIKIDISESECHSSFENTTHSVFRSAKFYFHHPVHLPHEQDICHESLGRSVFMQRSWKDFFHHHSDIHREHSCLPPPCPSVDKVDYTRIKSLSINLNLGDNEKMHTTKSQAKDHPKSKRQVDDPKKELKVTPELTTQCTVSLNELWNKYQERQKQQKPSDVCDKKELSLVERLDRLAKLLQNPITHSLQVSESTQDDSRGGLTVRGWGGGRQRKNKTQKQKWCKSLEKGHQSTGDLRKRRMLSPQQSRNSNQIKIEQIKFDKYILRKRPDFNYISNTSLDSRPSEESELLTDSPTNILSSTTSPFDSDVLTQTDREVTLHERSSSISTIDTARLIQAFGHERLYLSPRRIKLYSSITDQQKRYLEKRCKHKKALSTSHPQMTSEHSRRRHIQVADHLVSSDSVSSASSFLSLNSTLCNEQNVHMLNKSIQAGNLEIVTGAKKHTRDVGMTFPTPSSSEVRLEDSDMTSCSEEKVQEKMFFTSYLGDRKLQKNKPFSCEGASWFVPVENVKFRSKKENLPKVYGPGITWFEPITKTKPWREPLKEQNWQGQCTDGQGSLGGPGGDGGRVLLRPFVRATLQEALQLHRPDFISRSGERIKRLKLIIQERKLQNLFQSERDVLFSAAHPLPRRVFLAAQKNKPIGKKEMIQRSKRIYEQLPEVKKKREEEKRKSEYKSYRLRAQHYKTKVTNQLLGRKVPWD